MGSKVHGVGMRKAIQAKADEYNCFGWTQNQGSDRVVGEVRCNKKAGPLVQEWIENGSYPAGVSVETVNVKVYEDTKIKLHFSHFKILDGQRITCFRDEPHQCMKEEAEEEGGSATAGGRSENGKRGEL